MLNDRRLSGKYRDYEEFPACLPKCLSSIAVYKGISYSETAYDKRSEQSGRDAADSRILSLPS